jgi:hypothetical protein
MSPDCLGALLLAAGDKPSNLVILIPPGAVTMLAKPSWWLKHKIRPVIEKFDADPMSEDLASPEYSRHIGI